MKYKIIYADPPWEYKSWSEKGTGRSAEQHYETMPTDDISKLPINEIADKDCVLFMWATFPCLKAAFALGESWGFQYKTVAFTWVKTNKKNNDPFLGMGYYTRSNAEICMLFTKGKPLERFNKGVPQVIVSEETIVSRIGKHSQKPNEVRKRILDLFGDQPRIELFARERSGMFGMDEYKGWDVYGNQVRNSIKL
jgi:N6-adenosine-specific RNA methylase IME4